MPRIIYLHCTYQGPIDSEKQESWLGLRVSYSGEGVICTNLSSRTFCLPGSISLPFLRPVLH